ncbi:hypothetical protein AB0A05_35740 [Streptomyces sp. NPDC046374]|uniref:hypothetical protein n=1 Tax=Streptomyces sp. NPDC046374 TaxID=3154917 RepID=UPI003410E749
MRTFLADSGARAIADGVPPEATGPGRMVLIATITAHLLVTGLLTVRRLKRHRPQR